MADNKKPKQVTKPRKRSRKARKPGVEPAMLNHLKMVIDPCAANLTTSCYSGQGGVVTRHVTTGTLSSTTNAAHYLFWSPGGFRDSNLSTLTSATSFTPGFGTSYVPGYNFLLNTSQQARCIGACMRIYWNGTELNRGGSVATGVISGGNLPSAATTVENIFNMLQKKQRVPAGEVEIRWNPSIEDEYYDECNAAITVRDFNERNALCFAFMGATNYSFSFTLTAIYEWQPKNNQGQPLPPTVRPSVAAAVPKINNVLSKIKVGADNFSTTSTNVATTLSTVYSAASNGYKLMRGIGQMAALTL